MLKTTHKRRATTLSRTLLSAGLLGGAALTTLGAGSAQAAWSPDPAFTPTSNSYTCSFGGAVPCAVSDPTGIVGAPPNPSDKIFTLLDSSSIPNASILAFEYNSGPDPHPWHVDLDLGGPGVQDFDGGSLGYTLQVTNPNNQLITSTALGANVIGGTVTKAIYSSFANFSGETNPTAPTGDICTLTSSGSQVCNYSGVSQVWVRDSWTASSGTDNLSNDFAQSVPGPLPLLGAGAAFGFSRRIRSRIKGARLV